MLFIRKRNIILLTLFFILICFFMHDFRVLIGYINFDVNAPDLIGDGVMLRNKFHKSYYEPAILFPALHSNMTLLLPIMFLVAMYYYNKIKNKSIKYLIGKSKNVDKYLLRLKFKVAILPIIFLNSIILVYFFVSWYLTGLKTRPGSNFDNMFFKGTILNFADGSVIWYMFFLIVTSSIYILASTLLLTTILDYKYSYLVVFIVYFLTIYLGNDFIIMYIHRKLYFTASQSTALGLFRNYQLVVSYFYMAMVYIFFRLTHRKEF